MPEKDVPIQTQSPREGAFLYLPPGILCDAHIDRPAEVRIGRADSEFVDMCQECVNAHFDAYRGDGW